jgi:hypothetical protein
MDPWAGEKAEVILLPAPQRPKVDFMLIFPTTLGSETLQALVQRSKESFHQVIPKAMVAI